MVKEKVKIVNSQGLHMRPASVFAKEMAAFSSKVTISFNERSCDGKSLMGLIAACIKYGDEIEVSCEGEDEEAALSKATEMINSGFGEE